jgi:hypothetical protein
VVKEGKHDLHGVLRAGDGEGAAGILSTRDDEPNTPIDILNRASLALHPRYAEKLREETPITSSTSKPARLR